MLKLAVRNLLRQRMRTALTLAAIVLGVIGLVLSEGFLNDSLLQVREQTIRSQLGHLQLFHIGYTANAGRDPYAMLYSEDAALLAAIASQPEVELVTTRLSFSGLISNGRGDLPIIGEGVDPDKEALIGTAITVLSGRQLTVRDSDAILLGEGLARAMKLTPGNRVTVLVNTRDGALNTMDFRVVGVFRSFFRDYDARAVRIKLQAAQDLIAERAVNSTVVLLKDTDDTSPVAANLANMIRGRELEIKPWNELADFYVNTAALYARQFAVLRTIILILVVLGVGNSITMTMHERTAELGTMRALGRTGKATFAQLLIEYTLLGLLGALLGVFVAAALAAAISYVGIPMPPVPGSDVAYVARIRVEFPILIRAFAILTAATVVAAAWPAWRAQRVSIVDALRQSV